jgi:hypothetical protein
MRIFWGVSVKILRPVSVKNGRAMALSVKVLG